MIKSVVLGVVLLNCIILLACTRVQVEILRSAEESEKRTPPGIPIPSQEIPEQDPGKRGGSGSALRPDFTYLTETGEIPCATDRNLTQAVAQETGVWCWAASAQGVMSFHNVNPPQCGIVNKVKAADTTTRDGASPLCCLNTGVALCQQNGWPDEVFESYGIDYRWVEGPLSQRQIAAQICKNGPFAYSIAYEGGGRHTFVVKDYWMDEEEMWLWVDTHEYFKDAQEKLHPTGFKKLSYQEYANGWYGETSHKVDFTYILIKPQD